MDFAVITGVSRGLGESIAKQMMEQGTSVIGLSRSENKDLQSVANKHQVTYEHYTCDLSSENEVENVFSQIIDFIKEQKANNVYVVNNAGVVEPIQKVGDLPANEVVQHMHVNLIAPMLITNLFTKNCSEMEVTTVNITSGAANRAVYGWSTYGSSKAGVNYFTSTTALELEKNRSSHKIVAFSPGIMDTDMQADIRSASEEAFAEVDTFKEFKEQGKLRDTDVVAQAMLKLLQQDFENGSVYHVNDLLD
ncbi:(S)-benzoin forming benzil reductase [Pontibacillus marinus]|uniref:Short-chain dehydrogenase n=1 Tax=Pontibacillus marinus BH030004 = DSM 16465 TaxID=1385511 RepID=A0A0A5G5V7_9BACI|nr:(S)-benzoin forming benzil reductase [Pontibacillus marinus]KGX86523.1 short-chain dehydrogenase [Pontibacillus marinus BH030004 = DSM 16465]